jgi:hypothetical protein
MAATGPLDSFCDSIPIEDDHIGMVKFDSSGDLKFRNVGEFLLRLTSKHIRVLQRPLTFSPASGTGEMRPGYKSTSHSNNYLPNGNSDNRESAYGSVSPPPPMNPKNRASTYYHPTGKSSVPRKPTSSIPHRPKHSPEQSEHQVLTIPKGMDSSLVAGKENRRTLRRLAQWDVVFVIDDTNSMDTAADSLEADRTDQRVTTRWDVLVLAMQYVADIAAKYDKDGIDVHFLCSDLKMNNVTKGQQILDVLACVDLEANTGGTFFERALSPILQAYMAKYKQYHNSITSGTPGHQPKPMNIIVITDGGADDGLQTERLIVRVAKELDEMYAPICQLGIQFVQVGDDAKATKYLKLLDDRLEKTFEIRDVSYHVKTLVIDRIY